MYNSFLKREDGGCGKNSAIMFISKIFFHTLGQKRERSCLHQKNSAFTIKGDNLSVSTYSVESVDVCIHCYKIPKTKKTIIMFSTKRENHLYWLLLSLLCSTTLFVCVIWSGTKGSSDFFPLLFFVRRTYITRLTNIWIFVQSLIWMLKSINSWMARHMPLLGGKYAKFYILL